MPVRVETKRDTAIVILDRPPVNAISRQIRQGLLDAFTKLAGDDAISRVVLTGSGRAFAAGADAREFDRPPLAPHLPDVIASIETCGKPCIAAINGAALGGGYELALACGYRIASPDALLGLPEVTLGVVPGAGGTQRLPRLIGIAPAVSLISQGRVVRAGEALTLGLVDHIAADPLDHALAMDLSALADVKPLSGAPRPKADDAAIEAARKRAGKRMRGQIAPLRAIDLVALSATADFDDAMTREREQFLELRRSDQARALRHIFFAERAASMPAEFRDADPVDIRRAVVVGGGTMGAAIAYALDRADIPVTVIEADDDACDRAKANVERLFADAVNRGILEGGAADRRRAALTAQAGYDNIPPADLAIEAAFEDMTVKKAVFAKLEAALPAHAILATNTSYLDVNEIAETVADPSRVLGLHFFSPAHVMKLLEIVRAERTGRAALATAFGLAARLRKVPVLAGVCDGFIGNRIYARYREMADIIMIDGSLPWEIDHAMVEFGYAMGPYMAQDLSGLDIAYANRKRLAATRDPKRRYVAIADRMVEEGRLGRKAGVGWYRYPGGGGAVVDPLLEDLICEEAHFAGITRREFTDDEIRDRLLAVMVNEAFDVLDEGIARSASDIDLVLIHGYGFPRWRGGLLHYAETIGLESILSRIENLAREDPVIWKPSRLLRQLVRDGKSLSDHASEQLSATGAKD
ncbi:MAG: FAD-dependent oxidoreductase [Paracoccaceae bacterium]